MKYFFIFLFFSASSSFIFSQEKSGVILYKKNMISLISESPQSLKIAKEKPRYYSNIVEMDNNMKLVLENVDFELLFNKDESLFEAKNTLEHDKNKYLKGALGYGLGSGIYYRNNISDEVLLQLQMIGRTFRIKEHKLKWKLINESKIIDSYNCLKATTIIKSTKKNGEISNREIIAWYTLDIPISHGPAGFGGLPGLVISLNYGNLISFEAYQITFKNDIIIKKPEEGELVTKEQFNTKIDNVMNQIKR